MATRNHRLFTLGILGGIVASVGESCASDNGKHSADPLADGSIDPATRPFGGRDGSAASATAVSSEPLDASACDDGCPTGFLCCTPCCIGGLPPVCMHAVGDNQCPLPDLTVSEAALATKMSLDTVEAGACELEERCVSGTGNRKVLRFDVRVPNGGPVDLKLGNPDAGGPFEYAACHKHYHFKNFAQYSLLDEAGKVVVAGRKQAFCARDSARVDKTSAYVPLYDCVNQGIQKGWEDIYNPSLPCQYLDVTDLASGTYWLEVEVNPGRTITELRYDNNIARAKVVLP